MECTRLGAREGVGRVLRGVTHHAMGTGGRRDTLACTGGRVEAWFVV
jgi:hypothetical protein